jgi:hypothetical protein
MSRRRSALELAGAIGVLALALAIACRGLILGTVVGIWDVEAAYAHEFTLLADFSRSFQLLLWNPLSNGGSPEYLRDTGNLSPLNILAASVIGGKLASFWKYWLFFWLLGGVGILCLARHFRAPTWGGLVVALGFLFSGFYTGHASHTSYLVSASFLPWIVWRTDVALLTRRWLPAIEAGALWGLSALSGYPAFAILSGCFVASWALLRALGTDPVLAPGAPSASGGAAHRSLLARLGWAGATCVIVLSVGAPILSPTHAGLAVESAGYTDRSGAVPREVALQSNSLPPGAVSTMASPDIPMFKLDDRTLWPGCDVTMCSAYCGVLVPVLVLLALLLKPRSSFYWSALACGLAFLVVAMGADLPVRGWLYDWLPPTRYFRHPAIFRLYWILALSALALCATRDLRAAANRRDARLKFLGAAVVLAASAFQTFQLVSASLSADISILPGARLAMLVLWGGAVALGVLAAGVPAALTGRLLPSLLVALAFGDALYSAQSSALVMFSTSPAGPEEWRKIDASHDPSLDWTAKGLDRRLGFSAGAHYSPVAAVFNGGYASKTPTIYNYGPLANHHHEPLHTLSASLHPGCVPWIKQETLLDEVLGPKRIWFAERVAEVPPAHNAFEAFSARSSALGSPPLLLHRRESLLSAETAEASGEELGAIAELPPVRELQATLEEYTPRRLVLSATVPVDGWLWVTDRWARLGRVALAIEKHRARTGAPPERIEDLAETFADGLPRDPMTGAPFSYRLVDGRARLGPTACPEHGGDAC